MAEPRPAGGDPLRSFVERAGRTASHDLRAPLAAIVNFAAVLEESDASPDGRVLETTRRIRRHALQASEMVQRLLEAVRLAARPPARGVGSAAVLLKALASEAGEDPIEVRCGAADDASLELDAELVGFPWRAFLALERAARGRAPRTAHVRVARHDGDAVVDLSFDAWPEEAPQPAALDVFLHGYGDAPRADRFVLLLAHDLLGCHGGGLEVFGGAGAQATLRLRLPRPD